MTGKERVLAAIERRKVDRVPWVPWVGVHAAYLLGVSAQRLFTDVDTLVEGVLKGYELYEPDGLPVLFDAQLEAEALGCALVWAEDNPPAVASHPLEERDLAELRLPEPDQGRYPLALGAARRIVAALCDSTAVFALITGPFTLALHLAGVRIFTDMIDNPAYAKRVLSFASQVCARTAAFYAETGVHVITVVDSLTSQISAQHFREFVTPFHQPALEVIHRHGLKSGFFACGDATRNVVEMAKVGAQFFGVDENVDLAYARQVAEEHGVAFAGNLPLATVMLFGSPEDNYREAVRCMQVAGGRGFFLCPGCDLPFATPPANVQAVTRAVREFGL
ncbi:MAG: uroporphyrinogen decarboxylase family protein [Calditrichaeota bacterium]|nr:uroporphyrinogen decarboxylase family protein [Calditrichota bacterium]